MTCSPALEPSVGRERGHGRHAEDSTLLLHAVEPEFVGDVRSLDRQCASFREIGGAARMVDVPVRQQDLLQNDAVLIGRSEDSIYVPSGVDDRGPHRLRAPHDRTILLKRGDRDDEITHS